MHDDDCPFSNFPSRRIQSAPLAKGVDWINCVENCCKWRQLSSRHLGLHPSGLPCKSLTVSTHPQPLLLAACYLHTSMLFFVSFNPTEWVIFIKRGTARLWTKKYSLGIRLAQMWVSKSVEITWLYTIQKESRVQFFCGCWKKQADIGTK